VSERFRLAREEEVELLSRLVAHSFPGPSRGPEWWEGRLRDPAWGGGAGTLFVAEVDGEPAAACQLHPLRSMVAGREHAVAGVGSVAVSPVHRRRGLGARLIHEGLRHARDRGDALSALYPFRASFYGRLGYGAAGMVQQYRLPPTSFPFDPDGPRMSLARNDDDRHAVVALYRRWIEGETGQLLRTDGVWDELLGGRDRAVVLHRGPAGEAEAYCVVQYRTDGSVGERYLDVEERAWTTLAGQRAVYGWLASLGDQWREVVYRAHPEEHFGLRVADARLPAGSAVPWGLWMPVATLLEGPMFRILNLPEAFRGRSASGGPIVVALEVRDAGIPENAGAWRLRLAPEGAEVERGGGPADLRLELDVSVLSSLLVSGVTAGAAAAAGRLGVDRPDLLPRLDEALRLPSPWMFDRF
jgi:predicted acetyltransferase